MNLFKGRGGLLAVVLGLALAFGCDDEGCGMPVERLERDLDDEDKLYDGIQIELSPAGLDSLEENFDVIVDAFVEDGFVFDLEPDPGGCTGDVEARVCNRNDPCPIAVDLQDVVLMRRSPNAIRIEANLYAATGQDPYGSGSRIPVRACEPVSANCDARIHIRGKPIEAEVTLNRNPVTEGLGLNISKVPEIEIRDSDYSIGGGFMCSMAGLFKSEITEMVNDMLADELTPEIMEALDEATCMGCDFFELGCIEGTNSSQVYLEVYCDESTNRCVKPSGRCIREPLGIVGRIDLGDLLDGLLPPTPVEVHIAAGQRAGSFADPIIPHDDGPLQIRFITGLSVEHESPCVPPPSSPPLMGRSPRVDFSQATEAGDWDLAVGISERFLNKALHEFYRSGGLCLDIDSEFDEMISTGLFATFLPSLGVLTEGENTPLIISLRPRDRPMVNFGKGTYREEGDEIVMEEPLINIQFSDLDLDFYAFFEGRFFRAFTLHLDLTVPVGLRVTPDGELLPVLGDLDEMVNRVRVKNDDVVAEDPEVLQDIVPSIIGLIEPMLEDALGPIELPEIEGFELIIDSIEGLVPHGDPGRYQHIGMFGRLIVTL